MNAKVENGFLIKDLNNVHNVQSIGHFDEHRHNVHFMIKSP